MKSETPLHQRVRRQVKSRWYGIHGRIQSIGRPKVFCIGRNKTGTTSLVRTLRDWGFIICNQQGAKKFVRNWAEGDIASIVRWCRRSQVFNDLPFNLPGVYSQLHYAYPDAYFIHTVRSSADEWYESNKRYMIKRYARQPPALTMTDLREADYIYKGWVGETYPVIHGVDEDDLFNRTRLLDHYNHYNADVIDYFERYESANFISINVANDEDFGRLAAFLGVETSMSGFPHANRSR